jgi:hypothetical protein
MGFLATGLMALPAAAGTLPPAPALAALASFRMGEWLCPLRLWICAFLPFLDSRASGETDRGGERYPEVGARDGWKLHSSSSCLACFQKADMGKGGRGTSERRR